MNSDATEWRGPELAKSDDWCHPFTDTHLAEVRAALADITGKGLELGAFGQDAFPLQSLGQELAWVRNQLQTEPGFAMLRGFPVADFTEPDLRLIY